MMRPDPFTFSLSLWGNALEAAFLAAETQVVLTYRTAGLVGLWPLKNDERSRMLIEKGPAFAASALAAGLATAGGQRPDQVMAAAVRPLRSETSANAARLGHGALRD